ncbi:unnamed protein product, partial [Clonostachys rosea f. rosea IK726]
MARTEKTGAHPASDIEAVQLDRDNITSEKAGPRPGEYVENPAKYNQETEHIGTLERRLKSRHVQFLALSGAIGTGLFVRQWPGHLLAGPLSAVLSYAITGFNLFCVINSLGEMVTWLPLPGAVPIFATRYVDEALGFTLGWNYCLPKAGLLTIFYVAMVIVNCFPVNIYGEAEFIFGAIKLTTIVGLICSCSSLRVAALPQKALSADSLPSGKVFIQATFSYGGSEMVAVAAGETENPRRNIPKAVRRVFWRILLFYVLAMFLVCMCVSSEDPKLLNAISSNAPGANQSPFVIAIDNAKIKTLPGILNGIVLTSAWSAGNSFFYSSTRVLYSAALDGKAPAFLRYEKFGVPYGCVAMTSALGLLTYLNVNEQSNEVFFWISNISAVSTLIVWAAISYTYVRFYHALRYNGVDRDTLPFKSPLQPYLAWFSICFCLHIAFFNGFDCFFPGKFSAKTFIPPYIDIPIVLCLFFGYKFVKKTKFVRVEEMDIWSGKAEIDRLEPLWPVVSRRNFLERIWFWIA